MKIEVKLTKVPPQLRYDNECTPCAFNGECPDSVMCGPGEYFQFVKEIVDED